MLLVELSDASVHTLEDVIHLDLLIIELHYDVHGLLELSLLFHPLVCVDELLALLLVVLDLSVLLIKHGFLEVVDPLVVELSVFHRQVSVLDQTLQVLLFHLVHAVILSLKRLFIIKEHRVVELSVVLDEVTLHLHELLDVELKALRRVFDVELVVKKEAGVGVVELISDCVDLLVSQESILLAVLGVLCSLLGLKRDTELALDFCNQ